MHSGDLGERPRISFAGNGWSGKGGQGEFLKMMVFALDRLPGATIYSRSATPRVARSVAIPMTGFPWRELYALASTRLLRRRMDWLTLLSDVQFDKRVRSEVGRPDLFDGVMGQCCETLKRLRAGETKLVLTCLNTHVDNLREVLENEFRKVGNRGHHPFHPLMRKRSLFEIEMADFIRVNSESAKQTFVDRGVPPAKIRVIRPAIDLQHFRPAARGDDVFRVLAVATIDARKGIHYLLRAFDEARIPNSELVLIGGTSDRWSKGMLNEFLTRNANIRQVFLDVTTAPVRESYGSASVLVHPALEDGYALVVPQALSCGKPVIVTRQSGSAELVQDGRNGFVVESRSVEQLRDRLQVLASDRKLLEAMSERAPASVAHLSYDEFASSVLAFYDEVLGGQQAV
jgi:glycosyltransferase involved in cell wall biosynthesis